MIYVMNWEELDEMTGIYRLICLGISKAAQGRRYEGNELDYGWSDIPLPRIAGLLRKRRWHTWNTIQFHVEYSRKKVFPYVGVISKSTALAFESTTRFTSFRHPDRLWLSQFLNFSYRYCAFPARISLLHLHSPATPCDIHHRRSIYLMPLETA